MLGPHSGTRDEPQLAAGVRYTDRAQKGRVYEKGPSSLMQVPVYVGE